MITFCKGYVMYGLLTKTTWRVMTSRNAGSHRSVEKTFFLAMKLTAIILLAFSIHLSAKTHSQTISFSCKDLSLNKTLKEIEKQTGFFVVSKKELLANANPVSVNV